MSVRPLRIKAPDFAGRFISLPTEPQSWERLDDGAPKENVLILGLGPDIPLFLAQGARNVYWLDAADGSKDKTVPPHWRLASTAELDDLASKCAVYFYKPARRLYPDFWGPLLARLMLAFFPVASPVCKTHVWLPGNEKQLLHQELAQALQNMGYTGISSCEADPGELLNHWRSAPPALGICVNFRGLDSNGETFELCQALGIPLAIWLVDNPWNLLAKMQLPWWKKAHLFVTDASFLPGLQSYGAQHAHYLPLAAAAHMRNAPAAACVQKPLFVGRSAFPEKRSFFAGVRLPAATVQQAKSLLQTGPMPDFHWWAHKLGGRLWPGKESRAPSLGAEECSVLRRAVWLAAAAPTGLEIVGDDGWRDLLPNAHIFAPVDYYHSLAGMYANTECVLNVTSLLLPESLNQRHFDVWAAGGFLFSDSTKGLGLFPSELVEPMMLASPEEFPERFAALQNHDKRRRELIAAWRENIFKYHLYEHRLRQMLNVLARG